MMSILGQAPWVWPSTGRKAAAAFCRSTWYQHIQLISTGDGSCPPGAADGFFMIRRAVPRGQLLEMTAGKEEVNGLVLTEKSHCDIVGWSGSGE